MNNLNKFLKVAFLTLTLGFSHSVFAGSNSSITVNVAETDTGKGLVYVSADRTTPAADQVSEEAWWTTSSLPQNTQVENDTHTYYVSGLPAQGYKFAGIYRLLDEGISDELIPADDEGFCTITIQCVNPANVAIFYAAFQEADHTTILPLTSTFSSLPSYNLQGQPVDNRNDALLIRRGKKVIIHNH